MFPARGADRSPVEIFSDRVDVNLESQVTVFQGNVRLLFLPYKARCQKASVYLNARTQKVDKITMSGDVVIEKGTQVLKGRQITLDVPRNRLKIEGQVYTRFQLERPLNLNLN